MNAQVADLLPTASWEGDTYLVRSSHRTSGRQFQPVAEAALTPHLLDLARTLWTRRGALIAIPEFVGPYGIADLLTIEVPDGTLAARHDADIPPLLNETDAAIVATLPPTRPRSLAEVANRLAWDPMALEQRLAGLVRSGAVERHGSKYTRHPHLIPLGRMNALEAKVRDWRRATDQARTYSLWADSSTTVLANLPSCEAPVLEVARRYGMGLAHQSRWLRRPRQSAHTRARRLWASEHVVAALFGSGR